MPRLDSLLEELESRPFVGIAVPAMAGIALASATPGLAGWSLAAAGFAVAMAFRRRRPVAIGALAVLAFGAGALRQQFNDLPWADDVAHAAPAPRVEIVGRLVEAPRRFTSLSDVHERHAPPGGSLVLEAVELIDGERRRPASGRVRLQYYDHQPSFLVGETVAATGRLRAPDPPSNPGVFDRAATLRREGIRSILIVGAQDTLTRRSPAPIMSANRALGSVRNTLRGLLAAHAPSEVAALQSALLLGSREELPEGFTRALQYTGTAHFLAISGLNLVLVLTVFWVGLVLLGLRASWMNGVLILLLLAYTAMTGWQVSVVRAFLMSAVVLAGGLFGRRSDVINSLAFAAVLVLAIDPDQLFQPGFQLSFVAVAGIVLIGPVFHDFLAPSAYGEPTPWWSAAGRKLRGGLAVSLAAWLATAPIVVSTFHLVTPVIVIANFALGPLMSAQVALGMATLPAAAIFPPLADVLGVLSSGVYAATEGCAQLLTRLPGAHFFTPSMPGWLIGAYYGTLALWTAWARLGPSRWKPWLAAIFAGALTVPPFTAPPPSNPVFGMIDVGRGSCAYLRLPDGTVTVFDCGSISSRDAGANLAAPVLWSRGMPRVHTLVLSHADADHANGARSLAERMGVQRLVVPTAFDDRALLEWARGRGIEVVEACRGTPVPGLEILSPPDPSSMPGRWPANERSLVVRIPTSHGSILVPGDIEEKGTSALLDAEFDLGSDVLVAPHHAKRQALHSRLADRVAPRLSLVSAPEGYSDPGVLADLAARGPVLTTGESGWMEIEMAPGGPRVIARKREPSGSVR